MPTQTYQNKAFKEDVDLNINPEGTDKHYETINQQKNQHLKKRMKRESDESGTTQAGCKAPPWWGSILIVMGALVLVAEVVETYFITRTATDLVIKPDPSESAASGPLPPLTTASSHIPREDVTDCSEVDTSGIYTIVSSGLNIKVYCQVDNRGKFVVIQRRKDGSANFYRNWADYRQGFGNLSGEFWLGNDNIHALTAAGYSRLRLDLEDWNNNKYTVYYNGFWVAGEEDKYRLTFSDFYGSNPPGDSFFNRHQNMKFSTYDEDNDASGTVNCASLYLGGWWYGACHHANLNGEYNNTIVGEGINWQTWKSHYYSLKKTGMMLSRPLYYI